MKLDFALPVDDDENGNDLIVLTSHSSALEDSALASDRFADVRSRELHGALCQKSLDFSYSMALAVTESYNEGFLRPYLPSRNSLMHRQGNGTIARHDASLPRGGDGLGLERTRRR
jgi:hypothetical protein